MNISLVMKHMTFLPINNIIYVSSSSNIIQVEEEEVKRDVNETVD